MKHEDVVEEAEEEERWYRGPFKIILGVFLALLLVMMIFPHYGIKLDPEPKRVLSISELDVDGLTVSNQTYSLYDLGFVDSGDVQIKHIANRIASAGCESSKVCQAKAMYYFTE